MARRVQRKAGLASSITLTRMDCFSGSQRGSPDAVRNQRTPPQIGSVGWVIALAWCFICWPGDRHVLAGLSASEVVVAVNGNSLNSRTLANHYAKLRDIPSANIIVLDNIPNSEQITVQEFRELILLPLIKEIERRKLAGHVQCISYSADFPTAIDISQDLAAVKDLHTVFTPVGSLNGLTYLYLMTLKGEPTYISPEINFYARRTMGAFLTNPGGKETESSWSDASVQALEKDFDKARQTVDELIEKLPYQYPLKYVAASYAAQANQPEIAIKRLEEAISSGWTSGGYLASDSSFDSLRDNTEFQSLTDLLESDLGNWQPTVPFNARSGWAANGVEFPWKPNTENLGMRYLLSTVLGVTRGVGNTLDEAIASLKRSKAADFTHPQGAFYFSSTADIRTKTRQPNFEIAVQELKKMGFEAEVIDQFLPIDRSAVLGAQLGVANFDWTETSFSTLLPGAIVDNLTSFGGVMAAPSGQTPLTHLIAAGAAGSSGTVTEPYSVQFKFPTPHLYVHYAQGLSLAEAFYQSITGPYQLLIVGDPLCQPFSIAPNQFIDAKPRIVPLNGEIQLKVDLSGPSYSQWLTLTDPPAQRKRQLRPAVVAIQIDGGPAQSGNIQETVVVKVDGQSPGYHEVQVTAIADDPLQQRCQQVVPIWIGARDLIKLALAPSAGSAKQRSLAAGKIAVQCSVPEGATEVNILHHFESIASTEPAGLLADFEIDPNKLGLGPIRLQASAKLASGEKVVSQPLWVEILP